MYLCGVRGITSCGARNVFRQAWRDAVGGMLQKEMSLYTKPVSNQLFVTTHVKRDLQQVFTSENDPLSWAAVLSRPDV